MLPQLYAQDNEALDVSHITYHISPIMSLSWQEIAPRSTHDATPQHFVLSDSFSFFCILIFFMFQSVLASKQASRQAGVQLIFFFC